VRPAAININCHRGHCMNNKVFRILKVVDGMDYRRTVITLMMAIKEVSFAAYSVELRNVVAGMLEEMAAELRVKV